MGEVYEFEDVTVDTGRFQVFRSGQPIDLEPKAVDVLVFLIERRQRLVLKDELLDGVWKDTFVTPNALTRVIAQLRKALDDDAQEARVIETVPRKGYRFLPEVTVTADAVPSDHATSGVASVPTSASPRRLSSMVVPMVAAVFIAIIGWGWLRPRAASTPALTDLVQLTTTGYEAEAAIAADGRRLAFTREVNGANEIFVRSIGDGPVIQITSDGGRNQDPAWSPDGDALAYHSSARGGIWVVGALGGTARQVTSHGSDPVWSPDGKYIAFSTWEGAFAERAEIMIVPIAGGPPQPVTRPGVPRGGHRRPAFSRDGKRIAFSSFDGSQGTSIWTTTMESGEPAPLATRVFPTKIAFTPDDTSVCWSGMGSGGKVGLWCSALEPGASGSPQAILQGVPGTGGLSIARDGSVAYSVSDSASDLWSIPLTRGVPTGEATELMRDTSRNTVPAISPDGRYVAYVAWSPGSPSDAMLLDLKDLSTSPLSPGTEEEYFPTWSADGRAVLLALGQAAARRIVRVSIETRRAEELPGFPSQSSNLAMSPDGTHLAYHVTGDRGGLSSWIVPAAGGAPVRLSPPNFSAGYPAWSRDGKRLALEVEDAGKTQIWLINRDGTGLRQLTSSAGQHWPHTWAPDGDRIAFAGERDGVWNVWTVSASTGECTQLTHFTSPNGYVRYPAWSPTNDRVVFEKSSDTSRIWTGRLKGVGGQ
jgi:Tol biopolymer transport system component/DNA-binding winged helix-turn-helix (wHTH) protein